MSNLVRKSLKSNASLQTHSLVKLAFSTIVACLLVSSCNKEEKVEPNDSNLLTDKTTFSCPITEEASCIEYPEYPTASKEVLEKNCKEEYHVALVVGKACARENALGVCAQAPSSATDDSEFNPKFVWYISDIRGNDRSQAEHLCNASGGIFE